VSTPNPVLVAAAPSINASLAALAQFIVNLGPDPTKLIATAPGALKILIGTVELQLPPLVNAEWGSVQTDLQSQIASLQTRLAAAVAPASGGVPGTAKPA
jgi:hypothetical protein